MLMCACKKFKMCIRKVTFFNVHKVAVPYQKYLLYFLDKNILDDPLRIISVDYEKTIILGKKFDMYKPK